MFGGNLLSFSVEADSTAHQQKNIRVVIFLVLHFDALLIMLMPVPCLLFEFMRFPGFLFFYCGFIIIDYREHILKDKLLLLVLILCCWYIVYSKNAYDLPLDIKHRSLNHCTSHILKLYSINV